MGYLQPTQKLAGIALERKGFFAVDLKESADLLRNQGPISLRLRVLQSLCNGPALQAIEEEKDVSNIGFGVAPPICQPAQVGPASARRDFRVGRPIAKLTFADVGVRSDGQRGIDKTRVS